jgi:sulfatase maturation enzyme AslB (radical SAM superfamily)
MANSNELVRNNKIMDDVTTFFGKSVNTLCMIGSGDVFASKTFRNFLINFDSEKFPNVNSISIQTNGLLLNEDMWNKIIKSRDLIKMINISIDASTKKTYETVRRGGNWDILMNNLKFISKLNSKITFSFIVQDTNYMEMESAYELINKLSPTFEITYTKITNWGTFSEEEFKVKEIYNENHINFNLFLNELNKVIFKTNVFSNMNDIVKKYLT